SAVPAPIVLGAVPVALAVLRVVLVIVGDEVVEREPVVAGHEVDALLGLALLVPVDLRAAQQPVGHAADRARIAAGEAAHVVAESTVPLLPAVPDEPAALVTARHLP